MERSAGKGYHLVFERHLDLTQEENLKWASDLIGCKFDERAKDFTRVFYTTSASPEDLLFLSPALFEPEANLPVETADKQEVTTQASSTPKSTTADGHTEVTPDPSAHSYQGYPYSVIINKYWELLLSAKHHRKFLYPLKPRS